MNDQLLLEAPSRRVSPMQHLEDITIRSRRSIEHASILHSHGVYKRWKRVSPTLSGVALSSDAMFEPELASGSSQSIRTAHSIHQLTQRGEEMLARVPAISTLYAVSMVFRLPNRHGPDGAKVILGAGLPRVFHAKQNQPPVPLPVSAPSLRNPERALAERQCRPGANAHLQREISLVLQTSTVLLQLHIASFFHHSVVKQSMNTLTARASCAHPLPPLANGTFNRRCANPPLPAVAHAASQAALLLRRKPSTRRTPRRIPLFRCRVDHLRRRLFHRCPRFRAHRNAQAVPRLLPP